MLRGRCGRNNAANNNDRWFPLNAILRCKLRNSQGLKPRLSCAFNACINALLPPVIGTSGANDSEGVAGVARSCLKEFFH